MNLSPDRTVRELAVEIPNAPRVFEKFGIDYCCGGSKSLDEACSAAQLQLKDVIQALAASAATTNSEPVRASGSLAELINHIVKSHHKFTRDEIVRLKALFEKVCSVHGKNHPELLSIRDIFAALAQELTLHLMKEENVLFPYIIRMEQASTQNEPLPPPPFGTVQNPVRVMTQEHDGAGQALRHIREESRQFTVPNDACVSYATLYQALAAFEADLHQHIHLENNILFPRAIAMEENALTAAR
ncbi:MAG TPA: iron-sulfur cluster repair di-iron protein [Terriglobales bacterium]|nr:iron-sulfur cluster repair di-iron protein [Terriglobales bacterium]